MRGKHTMEEYEVISIPVGVYIYRYHNAEDGDVVVEQITLPAEYKKVTKFYEQM